METNSSMLAQTDDLLRPITQSNLAESTKHKYRRAIEGYINSGGDFEDYLGLVKYATRLSPFSQP